MKLHKSVLRFDESFNKSFMRYYELNLTNKLISLKKKDNRYGQFLSEKLPVLCENTLFEERSCYYTEHEIKDALKELSEFEKLVFNLKIVERLEVKDIAKKLVCNEKKIYNALDRIKNKLKIHLIS